MGERALTQLSLLILYPSKAGWNTNHYILARLARRRVRASSIYLVDRMILRTWHDAVRESLEPGGTRRRFRVHTATTRYLSTCSDERKTIVQLCPTCTGMLISGDCTKLDSPHNYHPHSDFYAFLISIPPPTSVDRWQHFPCDRHSPNHLRVRAKPSSTVDKWSTLVFTLLRNHIGLLAPLVRRLGFKLTISVAIELSRRALNMYCSSYSIRTGTDPSLRGLAQLICMIEDPTEASESVSRNINITLVCIMLP